VYSSAGPKARSAAANAGTWLWRQRIAICSVVLYLVVLLGLLARARIWRGRPADLWPPPGEVIFLAPLVLLLVGLAYARSGFFWLPVGALGLTGLLLICCGGLSFRLRPPGRLGAVAWAALGLVAGAALAFAILYHFNLLESVVHTWQFGTGG
jgi:hypothetical protein